MKYTYDHVMQAVRCDGEAITRGEEIARLLNEGEAIRAKLLDAITEGATLAAQLHVKTLLLDVAMRVLEDAKTNVVESDVQTIGDLVETMEKFCAEAAKA